jgi:CheY-like chemotaxis protein
MWVRVAAIAVCLVVLPAGGAIAGECPCSIPHKTEPGLCKTMNQCSYVQIPGCSSEAWKPWDVSEIAAIKAMSRGWEKRFKNWGVSGPQCEAIMAIEKARKETEKLIVSSLDKGVVDVLADRSVIMAIVKEGRHISGIDKCNDRWLRDQSMYQGSAVLAVDDLGTRDLASYLLTVLGYEVYIPQGRDTVLTKIKDAETAGDRVQAVIVDTKVADAKIVEGIRETTLSYNPDALVIAGTPPADDPLVAEFRRNGFSGLLPQPYEPRELWRILRRIVGAPVPEPATKAKAELPAHTG